MEDFVNTIITTSNRLSNVGLEVTQERIGALMLAGLLEKLQQMTMGLEILGTKITGDFVTTSRQFLRG